MEMLALIESQAGLFQPIDLRDPWERLMMRPAATGREKVSSCGSIQMCFPVMSRRVCPILGHQAPMIRPATEKQVIR
jgi:hypothetical protein